MHIVFTDLDGTLLDHFTYSFKESLEGISILKDKKIPLVLVSSKTFPEMKKIHISLNLNTPFIFENGGGIAYCKKSKRDEYIYKTRNTGYSAEKLTKKLSFLQRIIEKPIITLPDMDLEQIKALTGLDYDEALLSKQRSSSIPFILQDKDSLNNAEIVKVNTILNKKNLIITRGGRFYHFSSINANKGNAISIITEFYKKKYKINKIITTAIGDSENDIPMLKAVDRPVLVKKYNKTYIDIDIQTAKTDKIGPAGFTQAVKMFFSK